MAINDPLTKKDVLLEMIRMTGNITFACDAIGIKRSDLFKIMARFPDFAFAISQEFEGFLDNIEHAFIHRAINGMKKPVFYNGKLVGTYKEYSDKRLMEYLDKRRFWRKDGATTTFCKGLNELAPNVNDFSPENVAKIVSQLSENHGQGIDINEPYDNKETENNSDGIPKLSIDEIRNQRFEPVAYPVSEQLLYELDTAFNEDIRIGRNERRKPLEKLEKEIKQWLHPMQKGNGVDIVVGGSNIDEYFEEIDNDDDDE